MFQPPLYMIEQQLHIHTGGMKKKEYLNVYHISCYRNNKKNKHFRMGNKEGKKSSLSPALI